MADLNRSLVQNENAAEWLDEMSLPSAVRAHTGDPANFKTKPHVYNRMVQAQKSLVVGIDTVRRLTKDETKTTPVKHEAAERVARNVEADLLDTMNQMNGEADIDAARGMELADEAFKADPNMAFRDFTMFNWLCGQAAKPEGIANIRDMIKTDRQFANVLYTSKPVLLGIAPSVFENLKDDAVIAHVPEAVTLSRNSIILREAASKYPQVIRSMKASFYNAELANRSRTTRVDV